MLVVTLVLAAIGFGLLVIALMTGSIAWAWGCIAVCVAGGVILLASSLTSRDPATPGKPSRRRASPSARPTRGDEQHDSRE
ncbi:hypothetical protein EV641_10937 [Rhodococcus sp. SMB37]|uniref:hypothetical protein n=1 Tax=Rhodococcus sp. SMB37 TaxID=2512213 RepID=UPI0006D26ED0|nr:hypothetical protein [Rhodococcus sp. SMB37]TCN51649.1 hypothetical protein EV641_10937 [Rhodococcus sp. SMB37]